MSSTTSWTRIEPRSRDAEMRDALEAPIHDPLWLLARQWQVGEFSGRDAGTPVVAHVRAASAPLTRFRPGRLRDPAPTASEPYDPAVMPLEVRVEGSAGDPRPDLRDRADAGVLFARLLRDQGVGHHAHRYLDRYSSAGWTGLLAQPDDDRTGPAEIDDTTRRFVAVLAGRVIDGGALYEDLAALPRRSDGTVAELPALPAIPPPDRDAVAAAATRWLQWFERLHRRPAARRSAWEPERMEYAFAVAAPTDDGEVVLEAAEHAGGRVDWHAFDMVPGATLGAAVDGPGSRDIDAVVIPGPLRFPGMPASRWWEFEDERVDFGAVDAGPDDLARMLFTEFATVGADDWFVVPLDVDVGSLCLVRSLVVIDTFGQRTLVRPYGDIDGGRGRWRMFDPSAAGPGRRVPSGQVLLVPPTPAAALHGPVLEEVLFRRDELANLAWAIERTVQSPVGTPVRRAEQDPDREAGAGSRPGTSTPADAPWSYRLATPVPEHWIPLVPVHTGRTGEIRLVRGVVYNVDHLGEPRGTILEPDRPLSLFAEEVPRAGANVTRRYRYARWVDGSVHIWSSRQKRSGAAEAWSGLRFDLVEPNR